MGERRIEYEDEVQRDTRGRGRGCLVSSHKGRGAPLRTQQNQPATLTRNIHKPPPARAQNGEGVAAVAAVVAAMMVVLVMIVTVVVVAVVVVVVVGVATETRQFVERPEVSDTDTMRQTSCRWWRRARRKMLGAK